MANPSDLNTEHFPNWCPGCGNFGIWAAFKNAATKAGWDNSNSSIVAGIGCHGHIINFVKISSFEGLHGRAIPVASGVKYANPDLNVFVFTGDGDCLGEGGNHFLHACRRNHDITVILHNNNIYGLTTGQTSPTTSHGFESKSTPEGNFDNPVSPLSLAIAAGATFAARSYSGDIANLTELMIRANNHKGFSVIEIMQPCITFNKECSPMFFLENIYQLGDDHDTKNKFLALEKTYEWGPKQIPLGVFYEVEKPAAEDEFGFIPSNCISNLPVVKDISGIINNLR